MSSGPGFTADTRDRLFCDTLRNSSKVSAPGRAIRLSDSTSIAKNQLYKPVSCERQPYGTMSAPRSLGAEEQSLVEERTFAFELKESVEQLRQQVRLMQSKPRIARDQTALITDQIEHLQQEVADLRRKQKQMRPRQFSADDEVLVWQEIGKQYKSTLELVVCQFNDSTDKKLQSFQERISRMESHYDIIHKFASNLDIHSRTAIRDFEEKLAQVDKLILNFDQRLEKVSSDFQRLNEELLTLREARQETGGKSRGLRGLSTDKSSKDDHQRCREQVTSLTQKIVGLEKRLKQVTQERDSAQKKLEEASKRLKALALIKKSEVEGSFVSTDETPGAIAEEYEILFSHGRRSLIKATKLNDLTGKVLANKMFKRAYEECHQAVLQEMFKDLFHHVPGMRRSATRAQLKAHYGQLLHLKMPCIQANVDNKSLALKVFRDVSNDPKVPVDDLQRDPKFNFAQDAVNIALKMITIQPPMCIDYPLRFNDDVHIPQASHWCEEDQDKLDLYYFRPVLYSTCEQPLPIRKGMVGNNPLLGLK